MTGQYSLWTDRERKWQDKCMVHVIKHIMYIYTTHVAIQVNPHLIECPSQTSHLSTESKGTVLHTCVLCSWGLSLLLVARGRYSFFGFWFTLRLVEQSVHHNWIAALALKKESRGPSTLISKLLLILVQRLVLITFNNEKSHSTRLVEMGRLYKSSQSMKMLDWCEVCTRFCDSSLNLFLA